jgi:hypothetical protein
VIVPGHAGGAAAAEGTDDSGLGGVAINDDKAFDAEDLGAVEDAGVCAGRERSGTDDRSESGTGGTHSMALLVSSARLREGEL